MNDWNRLGRHVALKDGWIRVWIGITGGIVKYWIIPRVGDNELSRVGHYLAFCSLLNSYVHMFLCNTGANKSARYPVYFRK